MALNFADSSNFTPNMRWMASTSSWQRSGENGPEVITWSEAVFDLERIKTGWLKFEPGIAPEFQWDPSLQKAAPKPSDGGEWKRGFAIKAFGESLDGLREWATNSKGAVIGLDKLHDLYLDGRGTNPAKLPVVKFEGAKPLKLGQGHTSVPIFTISKWVDRPAEMSDGGSNASASEFG
jgi:hypothetical protein